MQSIYLLILFLSSYPPLLHSAGDETKSSYLNCPPFYCNDKLDQIYFPFNNISNPECGIFTIKDCEPEQSPKTQLQRNNPIRWYGLDSVSQAVGMIPEVYINDPVLQNKIYRNDCSVLDDLALPRPTELLSVLPTSNRTLFKCKQTVRPKPPFPVKLDSTKCNGYEFYYSLLNNPTPDSPPENCSIINVPVHNNSICDDLFGETANLAAEFVLRLHVLPDCYSCYGRGGECKLNAQGKYYCTKSEDFADKKNNKTLKIALGIGLPAIFLCLVFGFCYYKRRRFTSYFRPRNSLTHTRSDLEADSACYGVPVFSYKELQEATSNFDQAREVGDGGFGTVYHGKLKDGREVAVKRLYQHNWRRVEQFINEIQILTCLRHKNLVSLYGCTSRHSRELLLVYEYIPNGTVADHLHGERADPSLLTWRIRMSIAIETASALSYLHASDIIHRDVKTNNILLDNNFCVKVADFGLSRLFPNYVTHVSTAPQGTPGYVDPEYNQCYQLTTKSDVYSFGVVLIELISSMLAVDITRHRHEINLSTMAIDKILQCKYDELVDPRLGFDSDSEVQRMIIEVAGLAFQCLQQAKESRPTMEEVLTALKGIESGNDELENHEVIHNSPNSYEIGLSKNMGHPLSPVSVADTWASCKSSANISG